MWPINYEDPNRLHMSIGIGLLVAGFLLILIITNNITEETDKFIEGLKNSSSEEEAKIYSDRWNNNLNSQERNRSIANIIMSIGFIIFLIGYLPYLIIFNKKKNKRGR